MMAGKVLVKPFGVQYHWLLPLELMPKRFVEGYESQKLSPEKNTADTAIKLLRRQLMAQ